MISEQQHYRRKSRQYPPSIPAATLLATDSYPFVKRRIPVAPLIRLSGIDRLSYQQQPFHQPSYSTTEQQLRPQTPPPAYAGTLPPRYEEVVINHSDDDNIPLVQLQQQQQRKYLDQIIIDDEYETLDRVQQRLKSTAYNK